jgi:hypothetical protein
LLVVSLVVVCVAKGTQDRQAIERQRGTTMMSHGRRTDDPSVAAAVERFDQRLWEHGR